MEERDLSSNEKTSSAGDENGPIGATSKFVSIVVLASLLLSSFGALAWFDDVESGTNGWTHYWISGASVPDQWSISSSRWHSPSNSWYSGAEIATWVNGGDTALESPALDMTNTSSSYLNFWHWYEFDTLVSGNADGGIVEIDAGSGWTQIYPIGGYDGALMMGNLNPLEGLQAFGGASLTWQYESFNISSYVGTVIRIRFHVGWDYGTTGLKEGWYIDDIEITNSTLPQHDLLVNGPIVPSKILPNTNVSVDGSVRNNGMSDEVNVTVNLTADGALVDSQIIGFLQNGTNQPITLHWTPTVEKVYSLCLDVAPVPGEILTANNRNCVNANVRVAFHVAIYNHGNTSDISYFSGGNANNYMAFKNTLDSDPMSRFETSIITDLYASTLSSFDALILPDNAVPDMHLTDVLSFFSNRKGIIGADSAACYLAYSGLLWPASAGSNGRGTFWAYGSNFNDQRVILNHEITADYAVGNILSSQSSDASMYISMLPGDAIALTDSQSIPTNAYVAARDVAGGGRVVELGPFAYSTMPSDLLEIVRDAVFWASSGLPKDHDIAVFSFQLPKYVQPNDNVKIDAGIWNIGLNTETNIEVNFTVDGVLSDQQNITSMSPGQTNTLTFNWIPTSEKVYDLCVEITPIPNENVTNNNKICTNVDVKQVKAFVLFDQTHNCYPVSFYSSLVGVLNTLGYATDVLTASPLTPSALDGYDVFVLAEPHSAYTSTERGVIQTFVSSGHGLLIWGDYSSFYNDITSFAGITWTSGGSWGITSDITPHDVTLGVTSIDLQSPGSRLTPSLPATSLVRDVGGGHALAVSETPGRVGAFTDDAAFADGYLNLSNNRVLAVNLIDWLAGRKYDHDIAVSYFQLPSYVQPNDNVTLDVGIRNNGLNNETNVEIYVTVDGILYDKKNVTLMVPGQTSAIAFYWIPTMEKMYTICIEVTPVPNENVTTNNKICTNINVRKVKAFVLFDQTHNCYSTSFYSSFVGVLNSLGYMTDILTTTPLTASALDGYDVFVLAEPHSAYTSAERGVIQTFVSSGHGLLIWGDYNSFYSDITSFAGITWTSGGSSGITFDITPHEVTLGVASVSLISSGARLNPSAPAITLVRDVAGGSSLAVSEIPGRVGVFTDDGAFADGILNLSDNRVLAVNLIDWLVGKKYSHDVGVIYYQLPKHVQPSDNVTIDVSIKNNGLSNETNVEVNFTVDGILSDQKNRSFMSPAQIDTLKFYWIPTLEKMYTICVEVTPVPNENVTTNNKICTNVHVKKVKAFILFDQTHSCYPASFYSSLVGVLNSLGYVVDMLTSSPLTSSDLFGYDVFVLPEPDMTYSVSELSAMQTFVSSGHGLLLWGDYSSSMYSDITSFAGITWTSGGSSGTTSDITPHEVTTGVASVNLPSPGRRLLLGASPTSLVRDRAGGIALAVSETPGRVGAFTDERAFLDSYLNMSYNRILAINLIDWLVGRKLLHDISIGQFSIPSVLERWIPQPVQAVVRNVGLSDETNITVNLTYDGIDIDGILIPSLLSGSSYLASFDLIPTSVGAHDVTIEVSPIPNENLTTNNIVQEQIFVQDTTPPQTPSNFQVKNTPNPTELELTWTPNTEPDLAYYTIYMSIDGVNYFFESQVIPPSCSYTDSGLLPGFRYYYQITASDDIPNESPRSSVSMGVPDIDTDGDGIIDFYDLDDDNDGVPDDQDDFPRDPTEWRDTDGDGIGDNADIDDDGDGVPDISDQFPRNPYEYIDSDGDGVGDNLDTDDDNDGVPDYQDAFPKDPNEWRDTDGDGIGDNADTDDDGDGVPDISDQFPRNPYENQDSDGDGIGDNSDTDDDNDGVPDYQDAFPKDPNEWRDTDGDGIGDNADTDDDGDRVPDTNDSFPKDPNEWIDTDGDGLGDNHDPDDDNDGYSDLLEEQAGSDPKDPFSIPLDSDGDGIIDVFDQDDDGDGVYDGQDAFPLDPTEWRDSDGDGIGDNADPDDGAPDSDTRRSIELLGLIGLSLIVLLATLIIVIILTVFLYFREKRRIATEDEETIEEEEEGDDL